MENAELIDHVRLADIMSHVYYNMLRAEALSLVVMCRGELQDEETVAVTERFKDAFEDLRCRLDKLYHDEISEDEYKALGNIYYNLGARYEKLKE